MTSLEHFTVQLHVAAKVVGEERLIYSYAPIDAWSLDEARTTAHELRQCNKWGSATDWPHVTIHDDDGAWYPETRDFLMRDANGDYTPWRGR